MNLAIKFFCFILVIGLAGLFVLKKPDGQAWLSVDDFTPDLNKITSKANTFFSRPNTSTQEASTEAVTIKKSNGIYRWKDANNRWQYSDTPPKHQQVEAIHVSGELNGDLVEEYKPPKSDNASVLGASNSTQEVTNIIPPTLSPEKVSKLIEDANNIQQLIDDRAAKIEQYTQ